MVPIPGAGGSGLLVSDTKYLGTSDSFQSFGAGNESGALKGGGSEDNVIITGDSKNVETYKAEVSKGTGGFYTAEVDKSGQLDLVSTGKNDGEMTTEQTAFYETLCDIILNSEIDVQHQIVSNDSNVDVDDISSGKIDIKDAQQFDSAGKGGATTAGALIHATVEQSEKIKAGYPTGVKAPNVTNKQAHAAGINAENRVNGNIRGFGNNENFYLESNGRVTTQLIISNSGTIKVIKTDLGKPK